jgi:hypothetical protein
MAYWRKRPAGRQVIKNQPRRMACAYPKRILQFSRQEPYTETLLDRLKNKIFHYENSKP